MQEWYEFKNEIPLNTLKAWRESILSTAQMKFEGWTGSSREPYRHWCCYPDFEGVYKDIFECLNYSFKDEGFDLSVDRLILNMYNHGDSSWLHHDCTKDTAWTAILFLNEFWKNDWAGDFVIAKDEEIAYATFPTPGKFVLFKGTLIHGARPVSREAEFPRMALALQCTNNSKI